MRLPRRWYSQCRRPLATAQDAGPYPDTPAGAFYAQSVEALDQNGVFAGTLCDEGFCPDTPLDRATMAVWTVRVLDEQDPPAVTSTRFPDVEATHPHAAFIERFAELGVTSGCGDGTNYCPQDNVTRAHMAVFLSRAFDLPEGPDPNFGDVAADAWFAPSVAKLVASGVTSGCGDGSNFCPNRNTTRAQMATFLARALGLLETPDTSSDTAPAAGFTAVSAGNKHACAIRADKSLECWGDNLERQLNAPVGEFLAVSAGGFHTCAMRVDNTLSCWGERRDGQSSRPRGEFLTVSSGFLHSCAVSPTGNDDPNVQCWGSDVHGQAMPPTGTYREVSAGVDHSCGLKTSNTVQCWGDNTYGQGGVEDPTGAYTCSFAGCRPGLAPIAGKFISVSAGGVHSCGVRTDNTLHCWGDNSDGQSSPPSGQFLTVSAGYQHSCGLATDNTVHCWGRDIAGETRAPGGEFIAVSAGSSFSCGVRTNNSIQCWGINDHGRATPPIVPGLVETPEASSGVAATSGLTVISAGNRHACAIRADKSVVCWGDNTESQLNSPQGEFLTVSAGAFHTCAIRVDNTLACWGHNPDGQASPPQGEFLTVSAGAFHTCAVSVLENNDLSGQCWGFSAQGRTTPGIALYSDVSAGLYHSCGLKTDKTVQCWGDNASGQGGVEDPTSITCSFAGCRQNLLPIAGEFIAISAGGSHTCAIRVDNTLSCWGSNEDGQLNSPPGSFLSVSSGFKHSCALSTGNTVHCWGANLAGENNASAGEFTAVSAGSSFSCGLRADNSIECWGSAEYGVTTPPTN